jgi:hypothetical protein
MDENKRFHLGMIQGIVARLSQTSFLLKGWTITLISAMFALAAQNANIVFIYLAYFPAIIFWILDGYFLWQEKLYRALFDCVRVVDEKKINFSLDTSVVKDIVPDWGHTLISKTLILFHGSIIMSILIVMFIAMFTIH